MEHVLLVLLFALCVYLIISHRRILKAERYNAVYDRTKALESMEADLHRSHQFLDSIVENIPNMIFVKEASDLRFVRFNKAGEELLGIPSEELVGKNDYDFFPKEEADFFTAKDMRVLDDGVLVDIPEEPIHTKGKGVRILHTKKIPIMNDEGEPQYLLGISDDITDRKKAAELLFQKEVELARVRIEREQLDFFAHVASHDLQEPLQKISAFGDLLEKENGDAFNAAGRDYLDRMRNAAKRMSRMIDDLLKFARATNQSLPPDTVDLNETIKDVMEDLELRVAQSKARVKWGELPALKVNKTQMYELFQNIIGNAIKFARKVEVPRVEIKFVENKDETVSIVFIDNGIGFDMKYKERIFRPFERLHGRSEYDGSGIGLAVCQKIMARLGGMIDAESTPNKGSTFSLIFPKSSVVQKVA